MKKSSREDRARLTNESLRAFVRSHPWWHTALLVIGAISLVSVISGLFFAAEDMPDRMVASETVPPVDSPAFAAALSHLVNAPIERGGTVDILDNGEESVPALLESLREARQSINFSVFIWTDGVFSDRVLNTLLDAQRRGVAVRVLLDGHGARGAPDDRFQELERAGGRVERFRTPRFGQLTRYHRRSHRRAIVVDGRVGFTGGMAVYDKWLGDARTPDEWRDVMFRVTGPLATRLQAAFADAWAASSGEILVGRRFYPEQAPGSSPGVQASIQKVSSPADDDHAMAHFFLLPLMAARRSIVIATPYFVPDRHLKMTLEERARAGVDVRLLLPGEHMENSTARWSAHNHYEDLMEAGARVYEYGPTYLHSKFIVVDGQWTIFGSPNLNSRSRRLDEENAFGVLDGDLARRMTEVFRADLERAVEIDLEAWRGRSILRRVRERLSQILDQQS